MRLALFTDTLGDINGVARFILDMAAAARQAGVEMRVFTSTHRELPDSPDIINVSPLARMAMPGYRDLDLVMPPARGLIAAAREFGPDVLHVSTPGPVGLVGRALASRRHVPLAGTHHTDFPSYASRLLGRESAGEAADLYLRWFYAPFALLLSRSEAAAGLVRDLAPAGACVRVLRAGVRGECFSPRHRGVRALGREDAVRVLWVGRLSHEKNVALLGEAWRHADAMLAGTPAELVLVGDGPARADLASLLAGTRHRFLGVHRGEELAAIYAAGDLFVFPSTTDTLGQVVLEAQASGLPAIVSDRGGPSTIVLDGRTGLVMAGGDARAWGEAIARLSLDVPARSAMSLAAAAHAGAMTIAGSFADFWAAHRALAEVSRSGRGGATSGSPSIP